MKIIYSDRDIVVCIKPAGVLSTDEPGGLPELLRAEMQTDNIRTVHRLDRVVSGLTAAARNAKSASELSREIRDGGFDKTYLAVVRGAAEDAGVMRDLLIRDKRERKTYVADAPGKDVQDAELRYETLERKDGMSLVRIKLITGRTHQIRCQFSSRGLPLVGDRKYSISDDDCDIALWSHSLSFTHPRNGQHMSFSEAPPDKWPWNIFDMMC